MHKNYNGNVEHDIKGFDFILVMYVCYRASSRLCEFPH